MEMLALKNRCKNTVWDGTVKHALLPVDKSSVILNPGPSFSKKKGKEYPRYALYEQPTSLPNIIFLSRRMLLNLYTPTLSSIPNLSFSGSPNDTSSPEEPTPATKKGRKKRQYPSNA